MNVHLGTGAFGTYVDSKLYSICRISIKNDPMEGELTTLSAKSPYNYMIN